MVPEMLLYQDPAQDQEGAWVAVVPEVYILPIILALRVQLILGVAGVADILPIMITKLVQ